MEQNIKIIIIDGIILLITILAIILFVILKPKFGDNTPIDYQINGGKVKVKSELVLPLGSSLPNIQDLVKYNKSSGKIEFYYEEKLVTDNILDKIGIYKAIISVDNEVYESAIIVKDQEPPVLKVKNFTIKLRGKYSALDFVESCSDNSKEECIIDFGTPDMSN